MPDQPPPSPAGESRLLLCLLEARPPVAPQNPASKPCPRGSKFKVPYTKWRRTLGTNHRDARLPRRELRPLRDVRDSLGGVPASPSGWGGPSRRTSTVSMVPGPPSRVTWPENAAAEAEGGEMGGRRELVGNSLRPGADGVVMEPRGRARACAA